MPNLPLSGIAPRLSCVARELAHLVIDNLTVWDILRLLLHDLAPLRNSLLTHPACREFLRNDVKVVSSLTKITEFYWNVCLSAKIKMAPTDSPLAVSIMETKMSQSQAVDYMCVRISDVVSLDRWQQDLLTRNSSEDKLGHPRDCSVDTLKRKWNAIVGAQEEMNAKKANQIRAAADLLEENPDLLKRALDPSQTRRPNTEHILDRLRGQAAKASDELIIRRGHMGSEFFSYIFFPVAPFDAALISLLRTASSQKLLKESQGQVALDLGNISTHPQDMVSHLELLFKGMYRTYGQYPMDRVQIEPYSTWVGNESKTNLATFLLPTESPQRKELKVKNLYKGHEPLDQMELKWLEAFVKVYRYLEKLDLKEDRIREPQGA